MNKWVIWRHRKNPKVRYYAPPPEEVAFLEHGSCEVPIRAARNAYCDKEDMPPDGALPVGTMPAGAFVKLYEEEK